MVFVYRSDKGWSVEAGAGVPPLLSARRGKVGALHRDSFIRHAFVLSTPLPARRLFMNVSARRYGSNNTPPVLGCFSGNRSDASPGIGFLFPPRLFNVMRVSHGHMGAGARVGGGLRLRVATFIPPPPHLHPAEPVSLKPSLPAVQRCEHQDRFCVVARPPAAVLRGSGCGA